MVVLVRSDFVFVFVFLDIAFKALGDWWANIVKGLVERHARRRARVNVSVIADILSVQGRLTSFFEGKNVASFVTSRRRGGIDRNLLLRQIRGQRLSAPVLMS